MIVYFVSEVSQNVAEILYNIYFVRYLVTIFILPIQPTA